MKVLVIDKDRVTVEMLTSWLSKYGYEISHAFTGQQAKREWLGQKPDLVIVDPPRTGLSPVALSGLVHLKSPRIVYLSCDPATLARDLAGLVAGGYRAEKMTLVDLFPQTYHLETVVWLSR